jgi:hypothetical protein
LILKGFNLATFVDEIVFFLDGLRFKDSGVKRSFELVEVGE